IAGEIVNFSREPERRNEFIISVSYDADIDRVKQVLTDIVMSEERVLKNREITVRLNELGESSMNFVVRVWSRRDDLQSVYWDVLERIKREFDSEGISFPYPQMDIHLVRSGKQAESVTHNSRSVSSRQ
ncbi:mechanosensitive ion channel, partial [Escherichia coli]|nr:mechanosensitive ion channel [Escherichia coli]